ncbi:hypothetical protein BJX66DRAFT_305156 [Aspergillus keveii]|uniref:Uncharacterized protein n=1 Tax=Aspergillus keveii TaxID=714993 RepID=A0ABR4G4K2_9EURO
MMLCYRLPLPSSLIPISKMWCTWNFVQTTVRARKTSNGAIATHFARIAAGAGACGTLIIFGFGE